MAYGDGVIKKLGKDHYEIRLEFSDANGRRQVKRRIRGTRSEAVRYRDELKRQRNGGLKIDGGKITLSDLIEDWKKSRELAGKASQRTIMSERRALRHVERYLGDRAVNSIDPLMIERTYASIKEDAGLSGTTLKQIHNSLKSVFDKAVDYGYILRNPCDRVVSPSRNKSNRNALTAEDASRLLACLEREEREICTELLNKEKRNRARNATNERDFIRGIVIASYLVAARIALATGMRRGEIFGLTWNAFNEERNTLNVYQALTDKGTIKEPKTEAGFRTITVDEQTAEHLKDWKNFQAFMLKSFDSAQSEDTPICCSNVGGFVNLSNFEHWWGRFREKHGFNGLRFHELRHTQATQLLANGIDLRTVQDRMGHASAAVTMSYTHSVSENDAKAAELIGNIFSSCQSAENNIEETAA